MALRINFLILIEKRDRKIVSFLTISNKFLG